MHVSILTWFMQFDVHMEGGDFTFNPRGPKPSQGPWTRGTGGGVNRPWSVRPWTTYTDSLCTAVTCGRRVADPSQSKSRSGCPPPPTHTQTLVPTNDWPRYSNRKDMGR